ncbi:MAG: EamA family transporter [Candidatus Saganbacteria bacterium]|nr:EamA family transporter [Candidatus Saganbacteria bacterium]
MVNYILLAVSISLAIAGQMLMKKGMMIIGTFSVTQLLPRLISIIFNPFVFMGLSCFAFSSVLWLVILSRFQLSFVYPMVSMAYVAVAILSLFFFKESVTWVRWMGIFTICLGVFLISRS